MQPNVHPASLLADQPTAQQQASAHRLDCDACQGVGIIIKRGICRECGGSGRALTIDLKAAA